MGECSTWFQGPLFTIKVSLTDEDNLRENMKSYCFCFSILLIHAYHKKKCCRINHCTTLQCYVNICKHFIENRNIKLNSSWYHLFHFVDKHNLTIHIKHKRNKQETNLHHDTLITGLYPTGLMYMDSLKHWGMIVKSLWFINTDN
jgi:hypothetical protein